MAKKRRGRPPKKQVKVEVEREEKLIPDPSQNSKEIDRLQKEITKRFGSGVLIRANDSSLDIKCIPTGIKTLDDETQREDGQIGVPMGRIMELFGDEGSGKSTIALRIIGEAQRKGFKCAYLDCENAYDAVWAKKQGVDTEALFYSRLEKEIIDEKSKKKRIAPMSSDEVMDLVRMLIINQGFKIIVLDSVAALVPKKELEEDMGNQGMALVARDMSKAMRVLTALNKSQGTTMIFINQLRDKIGIMWGNPSTTTGGRALKFYSSVRWNVARGEWYPKNKRAGAEAQEVIVKFEKDKVFSNMGGEARFLLFFKDGHITFWDKVAKAGKDND